MASAEVMAAVRRKLSVTWDDEGTDARIADVVASVSPTLAARLGYEQGHEFSPADGGAWPLFLSACLYEFSGALDDFLANYAEEMSVQRALVLSAGEVAGDGS